MKLIDQINAIQDRTLSETIDRSLEQLGEFIMERAKNPNTWEAVFIRTDTLHIQRKVESWAISEGLEVKDSQYLGSCGVCISWGYLPQMINGFDATISENGFELKK